MPLVRIDLMQGEPAEFRRRIGEIVYQTKVDTINVPPKDNFQIITEHDPASLVYDSQYLNVQRTGGIVIIQITLNAGRTVELKKRSTRKWQNACMSTWVFAGKMSLSVSLKCRKTIGRSGMGLPNTLNNTLTD